LRDTSFANLTTASVWSKLPALQALGMDGLVQHCLREISFDGDLGECRSIAQGPYVRVPPPANLNVLFCTNPHCLGCDISRLQNFIQGYHALKNRPQTIDTSYCSFVWTLVIQQENIRVGFVPEGSSPVYIAPQPSQMRKNKKRKRESSIVEEEDDQGPEQAEVAQASLQPIDCREVAERSLEELAEKHGEALRIAVDHDTSFAAITGSHIRVS
jgi:oxalate---CoA ligase